MNGTAGGGERRGDRREREKKSGLWQNYSQHRGRQRKHFLFQCAGVEPAADAPQEGTCMDEVRAAWQDAASPDTPPNL